MTKRTAPRDFNELAHHLTETDSRTQWRWQEGDIDSGKPYIELSYGSVESSSHKEWKPIVRIGEPRKKVFPVQWLIDPVSPEVKTMMEEARHELDFFLIELHKADPWAYALYHCSTASNMYSTVHWSYFPDGQDDTRESSRGIHPSTDKVQIVFGPSDKRTRFNKKTRK